VQLSEDAGEMAGVLLVIFTGVFLQVFVSFFSLLVPVPREV
jgi:hypothetical protein